MSILTVGHGTRGATALVALLRGYRVGVLADVRTLPRSRFNPQFNRDGLAASLSEAGIEYHHFKGLGGWRRARPDSPHEGLAPDGLRGYADYMGTAAFDRQLAALIDLARDRVVAVMCAELDPARCHRYLLADALSVAAVEVEHIDAEGSLRPHIRTPWAEVSGKRLIYPFTLRP